LQVDGEEKNVKVGNNLEMLVEFTKTPNSLSFFLFPQKKKNIPSTIV